MKTTKRKFSPAQLAAQKRFAAMAKAGTLKRKRRNTTIIKAKKISHLDVSKVHNGLASAKKRPIAKKRNANEPTAEQLKAIRQFASVNGRSWKSELRYLWETGAYHRAALGGADPGYLQQVRNQFGPGWLRAFKISKTNFHRGQRQLFGVKNPSRSQYLEFIKTPLGAALKDNVDRAFTTLDYSNRLEEKKHAAGGEVYNQWKYLHARALKAFLMADKQFLTEFAKFAKTKKNPRRGTRKAAGHAKRFKDYALAHGAPKHHAEQYGAYEKRQILKARRGRLEFEKAGVMPSAEDKRRMMELRRQVAKEKRNGKKRNVSARKNGANTNLARKRRAEFVGRPSTQVKTLYAPNGSGASGTLAQLGKLHKLHIKGGKTYNFKGVPTLAQHPKTDQLFVLGKNYTVNAPKKNPGDRMVDLGEVKTIEYEAVKTHLGDTKPVRYYHHFGEEGGERPHALVNEEGLIIFSGGDYYIRPEGIRD